MRTASVLILALTCWFVAAGPSQAGKAKDYAYLSVQGKLTRAGDGRAIAGATVTLRAGPERFDSITDGRGVFVFEKLPVAKFTVEVRTADGEIIRNVRRFETPSPELTMLQLTVGRGSQNDGGPGPIVIDGSGSPIVVLVPEPRTRWDRLWKETLIFVGLAAVLAL
jgi:hypothetical protein